MTEFGIPFVHRSSSRVKNVKISLSSQGEVVVTTPLRFPKSKIPFYIEKAREWIFLQKQKVKEKPALLTSKKVVYFGTSYDVQVIKKMDGSVRLLDTVIQVAPTQLTATAVLSLLSKWLQARSGEYILKRVQELSLHMSLPFHGVALKQQKTRWGSCSSTKHLNFNWKLIHAPVEVIDYVIIHELAHTKHMNHGRQFWDLVATFDPDHTHHRRWLQKYGSTED